MGRETDGYIWLSDKLEPNTLQLCESCLIDWFGPNCEFECHCIEGTCDQKGRCTESPGICWQGWFGPYCQYRDLIIEVDISIPFLADSDTLLCLESKLVKDVRMTAFLPFQFTFLRVVMQDDGNLKNFTLTLYDAENNMLNCSDMMYVEIDSMTMDIVCRVVAFISSLVLSWSDDKILCEINLSRARSVALKQPTRMSSELVAENHRSYSGHAVDGEKGSVFLKITECAVTETNDSNPSWEVRFSTPKIIYEIEIYPRPDDHGKFMRGFLLLGYGVKKAVVLRHQDTSKVNMMVYRVKVATMEPIVKLVLTIEKTDVRAAINLCEFVVFGDCPPPFYGLNCDSTCDSGCKDGLCHVNGQCFECNEGLTGKFCREDINSVNDDDDYGDGNDKKTVRPKTPTAPGAVFGADLFFTVVYGVFAFIFTLLFGVFIYIVRNRKDRRFVHTRRHWSGQKPGIARHIKSTPSVQVHKSKEVFDDYTISESLPTETTSTQFTSSTKY